MKKIFWVLLWVLLPWLSLILAVASLVIGLLTRVRSGF